MGGDEPRPYSLAGGDEPRPYSLAGGDEPRPYSLYSLIQSIGLLSIFFFSRRVYLAQ